MKNPATNQHSDGQLLECIKHGDREAEGVLYRRHSQYAINLAYRYLRNRAYAEEVAHDAWLALHIHIKKNNPPFDFMPYFAAVIINKCRKASKSRKECISLDQTSLMHLQDSRRGLAPLNDEPLLALERADLFSVVQMGFKNLSEAEASALSMHYLRGLSYAEVAEALRTTESNIKVIAHRAINELRSRIHQRTTAQKKL